MKVYSGVAANSPNQVAKHSFLFWVAIVHVFLPYSYVAAVTKSYRRGVKIREYVFYKYQISIKLYVEDLHGVVTSKNFSLQCADRFFYTWYFPGVLIFFNCLAQNCEWEEEEADDCTIRRILFWLFERDGIALERILPSLASKYFAHDRGFLHLFQLLTHAFWQWVLGRWLFRYIEPFLRTFCIVAAGYIRTSDYFGNNCKLHTWLLLPSYLFLFAANCPIDFDD